MKWRRTKSKQAKKRRNTQALQPDMPVAEAHRRQVVARTGVLYGMVFCAMSALIARLGYLQIAKGSEFRTIASTTMLSRMAVLPARGWIYDAGGNILAYDKPSFSIYLTKLPPGSGQDIAAIARRLAPAFHTTAAKILEAIQQNQDQAQVPLFRGVTNAQLAFIEEHKSELPGVNIVPEGQRVYPFGDLAGQVLGYVGSIGPQELSQYKKWHYLQNQIVGKTGIEQEYERLLQGQVGYEVVQTNNQFVPLKVLGYDPAPVPGKVLQLTLDGHLQAVAQQVVMDAVQKVNAGTNNVYNAAAVMLDVRTGGVLAMVSYPYFDPNWMLSGEAYTKHLPYLSQSSAEMNHAIQSPLYPGSTVKPANLLTALKEGVITPKTGFYDHYITRIGLSTVHDDDGHGWVDPVKAITVSCDTFFYEVGLWFGKWFGSTDASGGGPDHGKDYQTWLETDFARGINALFGGEAAFGLGQLTGIDLPNEQPGRFYIEDARQGYIRVPYDLQAAQDAIRKQGYYVNYGSPADLAYAGIGQSQEFTPIELAQYVATIANNGVRLQPHLLDKVYPPNTRLPGKAKPLFVFHPQVLGRIQAKPEYWDIVHRGMYGAVNDPSGTAYGAFIGTPYKAAGKTGTAQITIGGRQVDNSVFIGYAPYDHPQVAVAVMVPGAGYGATTAAPIARQLFDTYFKEHHEYFPKDQWEDMKVPADWSQSPAYTVPENAR
ncbi:penicillin-binding protein [Alicyclobacillus cellulosilyticus]|uniref:Penicillin-binding protein n=1 Tax=Alicyclobacillus cellulosilyticus TaxID=1003997 RepID=A0A917KF32_9BACL|nr:penicillin-binding transpeptidase domain-containing protein [Alicyclobacillus cellulosilyticus]GGJ11851.1 penicillin-binding protein [Alicyclobacillus cellulosilyticus]